MKEWTLQDGEAHLRAIVEHEKRAVVATIDRRVEELLVQQREQAEALAGLPRDLPGLLQAAAVVVMGTVEVALPRPLGDGPWGVELTDEMTGRRWHVRYSSPWEGVSLGNIPDSVPRLPAGQYRLVTLLLPLGPT